MNNLNKKEKVLLTVILAACLSFLYIRLYLPKQTAKIDTLKSNIGDNESKLEALKVTSLLNIKLRKELDELELQYKKTIAAFPKDGRVPEIAYNFDKNSKANNIAISKAAIGESQEYQQEKEKNKKEANNAKGKDAKTAANTTNAAFKLYVIPTTLSVSGEYLKVNSFLSAVEKDNRLANIEQILIKTTQGGKVTADLSTNYYYVPGLIIDLKYDFNDGRKNKEDMFK